MRIAIVTDAWHPQINGVVMTLAHTRDELVRLGHEVLVVSPQDFWTVPCPTYLEIRLAPLAGRALRRRLDSFGPESLHIATEGPLGFAARSWALRNRFPFTTSFHTRFPEYVRLRTGIPLAVTYALIRWFHLPAHTVMVATPTLRNELAGRGIQRLGIWSRGVDTQMFRPRAKGFLNAPRPIFMFVGRVAIEKNIEAFLRLDLPGTKYVVGAGPDRDALQRRYPDVRFTGYKLGEELARYLAAADAFVFPSRTDTFGLVLIEALSCGVPVAAYPVQGPIDIIENSVTGYLDDDLGAAAQKALSIDPQRCRAEALKYTWAECTQQFLGHLSSAAASATARAKLSLEGRNQTP